MKNVDKTGQKILINRLSTKSTFCCGKLFNLPYIVGDFLKKIFYFS
jgi:hypothetical protein